MMTYNHFFALMLAPVLMVPSAFAGSSECSVKTAPGGEAPTGDAGICAFYSIQQGETNHHSANVPPGSSTLFVNLDWFIPSSR
ncbi:hypothetical protein [Methanoculleus receptaculi]|uniref:Secreted protein n=1 Tax=Methanoculleus receptaculi TaxID=394967 RepID=A0AAX4FVQ5_9EURY|nr:hypothetical protein [Methanoculleus receptaculi]WOX57827.1 hypothetical protein R6Y96_00805 [Methanoculleus receptaculi]